MQDFMIKEPPFLFIFTLHDNNTSIKAINTQNFHEWIVHYTNNNDLDVPPNTIFGIFYKKCFEKLTNIIIIFPTSGTNPYDTLSIELIYSVHSYGQIIKNKTLLTLQPHAVSRIILSEPIVPIKSIMKIISSTFQDRTNKMSNVFLTTDFPLNPTHKPRVMKIYQTIFDECINDIDYIAEIIFLQNQRIKLEDKIDYIVNCANILENVRQSLMTLFSTALEKKVIAMIKNYNDDILQNKKHYVRMCTKALINNANDVDNKKCIVDFTNKMELNSQLLISTYEHDLKTEMKILRNEFKQQIAKKIIEIKIDARWFGH